MKIKLKVVTTITGFIEVEADSPMSAVSSMKQKLIDVGYTHPIPAPDVQHEIYVRRMEPTMIMGSDGRDHPWP